MARSAFSPELFEEIEQRIAEGETLSEICREDGRPSRFAVYRWIKADPGLARRFDAARELGFDRIAEVCIDIADDTAGDIMITENGPSVDREHIQRSRLRVETRIKLLSKWSKRYSDRLELAGDKESPLLGMSDDQLDARITMLLEKGRPSQAER